MVILYLYDALNGYRYRKLSYAYYERSIPFNASYVVAAWVVPGTV
jgi:hypothetical protein